MNTKYIIAYLVLMTGITLYFLSVYFNQASADYGYECMNAYNLQYQLDELADEMHNTQMMLSMPELKPVMRARLRNNEKRILRDMNKVELMFNNWFQLCK